MHDHRIILLATSGDTTNLLYHAIDTSHGIAAVVIESKPAAWQQLKKRIRFQGFIRTFGQILFKLLTLPLLRTTAKKRIASIIGEAGLHNTSIPEEKIHHITSVNSAAGIEQIKLLNPRLIIIHGTRVLSGKTLAALPCPVINIHAGITPQYRGVHGGYWALALNDAAHCGVTLHYVDEGIDTGNIIAQQNIHPGKADNFVTYPYLQLVAGIALLQTHLDSVMQNNIPPHSVSGNYPLRLQPTIWEYWYYRWVKKVM